MPPSDADSRRNALPIPAFAINDPQYLPILVTLERKWVMTKIKTLGVAILILLVSLLPACATPETCSACGRETKDLVLCPICSSSVCEYCADDEWYLEELLSSGKLQEYLEVHGYAVYRDQQELYNIYAFGFLTGYDKGKNGVFDEEVKEFQGWDYASLQESYGDLP